MSYQHKNLAAGRWQQLSFIEQMANIGSEVERAINWKAKGNIPYFQQSFDRTLELLDLTLSELQSYPRLKEVARVRESLVDFLIGENQYASSDTLWKKYFLYFTYAARRNR